MDLSTLTAKRWAFIGDQIAKEMEDFVRRFITPISREVEDGWGELVGSGSYVQSGNECFGVTNEHVLRDLKGKLGGHHLLESIGGDTQTTVVKICRPFATISQPVDTAVFRVSEAWNARKGKSEAIPITKFSDRHDPVNREVMFLFGYPGERSKSLHGHLFTRSTPYTTQQPEPVGNLDFPEYDFHLHYPRGLIRKVGGAEGDAPLPPGLSGSLVWNTRFVEVSSAGEVWTPGVAEVTGILKRWIEKEEILVGTRVEKMRLQELCSALEERPPVVKGG